ncbi:MAG TPA: hypothetical protein VGW74_00170, partial [Propionibacteriaceae bacterium]|nr:hypothetical protein [Propionibacteriaceae bacterium]
MTDATFGSTHDSGSTADQVKDQVRDKAHMAQDKTRGALGQARGRLSEQVDQRSTQAGERLSGQAADARSIAEELRSQGKDAPATIVEQVAGQADRVGDYLKGASGDRILRDVEDFTRRQPWLVAASGLALGFAASRFMKASSSRRYESGYGDLDRSYAREPLDGTSSYRTSPYDTSATVGTTAGYGTEASYTPVSDAPVGSTYDPDP